MSVQLYCPKCDKHLGSVWPTDEADWEKVTEDFEWIFGKAGKAECKEYICKYEIDDRESKEEETDPGV